MGSPGLWVGDTGSCKNKEGLGSREMGRGQRVSSALGSSGDKPKTPVGSPKLPGLSTLPALSAGSCRVQSETPWRSWGQQSPGSQGPCWPCRWPGGVKPVASWAALGNGKWGSPRPLPHGEGAAAQSPVLWSANTPLQGRICCTGVVWGVPKAAARGRTPPAPGHGSPGQSAAPSVRRCLSSSWDNGRQGERGEKKPWQFSAGFYLTWRQRAALCEGGTEAAHGNFLAFPLNRGFFTTSKFR